MHPDMKAATTAPQTIDDYIAGFPPRIRTLLSKMRATIRKAAPAAQEKISYRMPAFTLEGALVYFAAFTHHIGLYPPVRDKKIMAKAAAYAGEKGNLRFPFDQPIPYELVTEIVKARVQQNLERAAARKKKPK